MDDIQQEVHDEPVDSGSPAESVEVGVQAETEAQEPKVQFNEAQQAKIEEIKGKQAGTFIQTERKLKAELEEERRKNTDLQAQIPQQTAPDVPQMPTPDSVYDDPEKFQQDMQNWQTATEQRSEYQATLKAQESQQAADAQRTAQEQHLQQQQSIQTYTDVAQTFNIDANQMQQDAAQFHSANVHVDTQDFILRDPQGPLIANHLAKNIIELDKVSKMTPTEASAYIATEIRPKLASARKETKALKPAEILGGAGVPEKVNHLIKDAVFSS